MASMIAQSLAEFILHAPQHEQANLMADALATLGTTFLDKQDDERPHKPHKIYDSEGYYLEDSSLAHGSGAHNGEIATSPNSLL